MDGSGQVDKAFTEELEEEVSGRPPRVKVEALDCLRPQGEPQPLHLESGEFCFMRKYVLFLIVTVVWFKLHTRRKKKKTKNLIVSSEYTYSFKKNCEVA